MRQSLSQLVCRWVVLGLGAVIGLSLISCTPDQEPEAARSISLARDIEGDVDRLGEAIEAYRKVASDYGETESGKKASERAEELAGIADMIPRFLSAPEDSLPSVSGAILRIAPNYEPILYRLGTHYAERSKLYTRMASTWKDPAMGDRLMRVWNFQDSLWSAYLFRPTHGDRGMRDVLCRHAINVARMMGDQKRYSAALSVIERAIFYGSNKDELAEARVFGAFYMFRNGDSDSAYSMATEALENDDLVDKHRAKAYHVQGLISTYRYQDNKQVVDLDQAIKSLNEAVVLDPGIGDTRALLKQLRKARGKLQAS